MHQWLVVVVSALLTVVLLRLRVCSSYTARFDAHEDGGVVRANSTCLPVVVNMPRSHQHLIRYESALRKDDSCVKDSASKLAISLSGRLRTFRFARFNFVESVLKPNGFPDIFVHIWYDEEVQEERKALQELLLLPGLRYLHIGEYNPKTLQKTFARDHTRYPYAGLTERLNTGIDVYLSQTLSLYISNMLRKTFAEVHGISYDLCMRTRLDILFDLDYPPLYIPSFASPEALSVPFLNDYGGLNDQLALGGCKLMDVYSSIYKEVPQIVEDTKQKIHAESFLRYVLSVHGVEIRRIPVSYCLLREDFSCQWGDSILKYRESMVYPLC